MIKTKVMDADDNEAESKIQVHRHHSDMHNLAEDVGKRVISFGSVDRCRHRENKGFASVVAPMVATDVSDDTCEQLTTSDDVDPELARLIAAWPKLSRNLQRAILALIQE